MAETLRATDYDGMSITFTDYVREGATVTLWEDPSEEQGWLGDRVVWRDGEKWMLRPLTEAERRARVKAAHA